MPIRFFMLLRDVLRHHSMTEKVAPSSVVHNTEEDMANTTKADAAAALQAAGIQRKSFTIPELCARNSISEGFYRKLRTLGKGARETRVLDRVFITDDAEREWLEALAATETTTA
jgi:hypothetical protein